jgi:outer membrane protein TolC
VFFALLAGMSSRGEADVVGRALKVAAAQPGGPSGGSGGSSSSAAAQAAGALSTWAGQARATTLAELLQSAVRQSPALQNAKLDIAIAEARIQQTWARNEWAIGAQLTVTRSTSATQGTSTGFQLGADVTRRLPTGGTVGLHADSGFSRTSGSLGGVIDGDSWVDNLNLAITQPLLRGRGRDLFDASEARATLARDTFVLARRLAAIQAVQTVISAYWDLVLAEQTVAITQGSLDLARERLRVTQIGADGGKVPRSEIPAVLQIIATREEDVLNGELGVLNASIGLRRASGMPIGSGELGLRVGTDLDTKDQPFELAPLLERAYTASPELAQLAKQEAISTIDIEVTENGLLPQLDLALRIGPTGAAENFGDAWSNLVKFDSLGVQGGLTFSHTFGQNGVRGLARELRETRRKVTVNAVDIRAQIAQAISRAVAQLELAKRRVTLSQRAIDLANENTKIETDRFNLGKSTNFDVLNRLEELRQAELRKAQALIDWHKAEVSIQALTGDLLPSYGVSVD